MCADAIPGIVPMPGRVRSLEPQPDRHRRPAPSHYPFFFLFFFVCVPAQAGVATVML